VVPVGQQPRASKNDDSPSVLFGDVMTFYKGSSIKKWFADSQPPTCSCAACDGRALDRFLSRDDSDDAHFHNLFTWASWVSELQAQPTIKDRALLWRRLCATAVKKAHVINTQIRQPDALKAQYTVRTWAQLPAWPGDPGSVRPPHQRQEQ
jgi:hypothetical protein